MGVPRLGVVCLLLALASCHPAPEYARNTCGNAKALYRRHCCGADVATRIGVRDVQESLIGRSAEYAMHVRNLTVNATHLRFEASNETAVMLDRPYFGGWKMSTAAFIRAFGDEFSDSSGGGPTTVVSAADGTMSVIKLVSMMSLEECNLCDTLRATARYLNVADGESSELPLPSGVEVPRASLFIDGSSFWIRDPPEFISNDHVQQHILLPPDRYPEPLHGAIWMDQSGAYAPSNVSGVSAPDLLMTLGGGQWDAAARTVTVSVLGRNWQWANSGPAYRMYAALSFFRFEYEFSFDETYSAAQIVPVVSMWGVRFRVPTSLLSFRITRQWPSPGECPPAHDAPKEAVARCAKWKRESTVLGAVPGISSYIGTYVYYAFEVVDQGRNPVEPYYSQYLAYANSRTDADAAAARQDLDLDLPPAGRQADTSFLGGGGLRHGGGADYRFPGFPLGHMNLP